MNGPVVPGGSHAADAVDERLAVFSQQFAGLAEFRRMADTDVLDYADGDNAIKAAGAFAVVNLANFSRLRTFARHADLRGGDVMAVTRAPVKRAIPVGSRSRRPPCLHAGPV
jgi:hypothetical protein